MPVSDVEGTVVADGISMVALEGNKHESKNLKQGKGGVGKRLKNDDLVSGIDGKLY